MIDQMMLETLFSCSLLTVDRVVLRLMHHISFAVYFLVLVNRFKDLILYYYSIVVFSLPFLFHFYFSCFFSSLTMTFVVLSVVFAVISSTFFMVSLPQFLFPCKRKFFSVPLWFNLFTIIFSCCLCMLSWCLFVGFVVKMIKFER